MTEQELLDLKQKVDSAKETVAELKGQLNAMLKQLKEDWGVKNIPEAEDKLEDMGKDIAKLEKQINEKIEELEKLYEV